MKKWWIKLLIRLGLRLIDHAVTKGEKSGLSDVILKEMKQGHAEETANF